MHEIPHDLLLLTNVFKHLLLQPLVGSLLLLQRRHVRNVAGRIAIATIVAAAGGSVGRTANNDTVRTVVVVVVVVVVVAAVATASVVAVVQVERQRRAVVEHIGDTWARPRSQRRGESVQGRRWDGYQGR